MWPGYIALWFAVQSLHFLFFWQSFCCSVVYSQKIESQNNQSSILQKKLHYWIAEGSILHDKLRLVLHSCFKPSMFGSSPIRVPSTQIKVIYRSIIHFLSTMRSLKHFWYYRGSQVDQEGYSTFRVTLLSRKTFKVRLLRNKRLADNFFYQQYILDWLL